MRRSDQFYRKARKFNWPSDWSEYRMSAKKLLTRHSKKARKTYFAEKLEEIRPNPHDFWKTLKQVLPNKNVSCNISGLIVDNKELTGHKDIGDAMNSYFTSTCIASSLMANLNLNLFQMRHHQISNPSDLLYKTKLRSQKLSKIFTKQKQQDLMESQWEP